MTTSAPRVKSFDKLSSKDLSIFVKKCTLTVMSFIAKKTMKLCFLRAIVCYKDQIIYICFLILSNLKIIKKL